jgi:hypothetical protein
MEHLISMINYQSHEIFLEKHETMNVPWGQGFIFMDTILGVPGAEQFIENLIKIRVLRLG